MRALWGRAYFGGEECERGTFLHPTKTSITRITYYYLYRFFVFFVDIIIQVQGFCLFTLFSCDIISDVTDDVTGHAQWVILSDYPSLSMLSVPNPMCMAQNHVLPRMHPNAL